MKRHEHLLLIAMEECDETSQRISKALRFTLGESQPGQEFSNAYRILEEFNQLIAVMEMLEDEGVFGNLETFLGDVREKKKQAVEKWLEHSYKNGTLEKPKEIDFDQEFPF